ncbi:MAG: magnesium transporter [Candidatus Proteinoplasmatales archaeon SG8-5]|nr:MAG: magnesium transporter [Candidatus Proteinoplasmatales archaeon SG8-5]
MPKVAKKRTVKVGLPPGTLVYTGEVRDEPVRTTYMIYDAEHYEEGEIKSIEELNSHVDKPEVTWINVDGIHDTGIIESIGNAFKLHPSILEDIVDTEQRPRMEDFDDYIFVTLKMLVYKEKNREVTSEHISLILGPNYLITFQERPGDIFDIIRGRIRTGKGRIRQSGDDYLAYALIDTVIDQYYIILERIGEVVEEIEEELMSRPKIETLQQIYYLKREMIFLRKSVWPLREVIGGLDRSDSALIKQETGRFFRDVYDHTIQAIDMVETYRDMLSGMLDLYLSSISNRMNEVMKVLTIIATIFIPLTFIAGVYGMNFLNMPELRWEYGYYLIWLVMLIITMLMVIYFKRKRWL